MDVHLLWTSTEKEGFKNRMFKPSGLLPNVWGSSKKLTSKEEKNDRKVSWVVTDDRRHELLETARSKRLAWIENSPDDTLHYAASTANCNMDTIEKVVGFLQHFDQDPAEDPSVSDLNLHRELKTKSLHAYSNGYPDSDRFLVAYQGFMDILKKPVAVELVGTLRAFVDSFKDMNLEIQSQLRDPLKQPGGIVREFITRVKENPLLNESNHLLDDEMKREVLEAFLMEKLYPFAFRPSFKDEQLHQQINALAFVDFEHLDISVPEHMKGKWMDVQDKLQQMGDLLSPRRKVECILTVSQQLTTLLKESNANNSFPSADEFLPALIYVILQTNPAHLHATIDYISQYRHPSRLLSEPGYFFTHFVSSVSFIENLDQTKLTISSAEFESRMADTIVTTCNQLPQQTADPVLILPTVQDIRTQRLSTRPIPTSNEPWENKRPEEDQEEEAVVSKLDMDLEDCTFYDIHPDEIRARDVPDLLSQYKWLYWECRRLQNPSQAQQLESKKRTLR